MAFVIAPTVAACVSITDSVDGHLTEMNISADNFRNQAILLNILRARQGAPLSFVSVATIQGQYNSSVNAGLPSYSIGPLAVQSGRPFGFSNSTLSGGLQSQSIPNFNNLVGKDFTQAATTAVSALQLLRFARDGFPIDLLLSLTTSKIIIYANNKYFHIDTFPSKFVDCPYLPGIDMTPNISAADCFRRIRESAEALRLDFEATRSLNPNKETIAGFNIDSKESKIDASIDIDAKICFNNIKPEIIALYEGTGFHGVRDAQCGRNQGEFDYKVYKKRPKNLAPIQAEFRSLVGIYRFLGGIYRRPDLAERYLPIDNFDLEPLLDIKENTSGPCFVEVGYQGQRYCVPEQGARKTKAIFALLDQIQNNSTDISKLPQPSVVNLSGRLP
ncbi:hypothetical protein [Methylobacterium platani]|uniref:hypothetical protein n=1 Tax=Methylobacterium platani TaxID=427683 RepID=UPI0012E16944|nr:hypothetical protein [Methylobacterium platani]